MRTHPGIPAHGPSDAHLHQVVLLAQLSAGLVGEAARKAWGDGVPAGRVQMSCGFVFTEGRGQDSKAASKRRGRTHAKGAWKELGKHC